jgi:hypothetical protein
MLDPNRRKQMDAIAQSVQAKPVSATTLTPERKAQMDAVVKGISQPKSQNLVQSFLAPGKVYAKQVLEAGNQAGRFITDPTFRKSVLSPITRQQLTDEENMKLANEPVSKFMSPKEIGKYSTPKDAVEATARATAGGASYPLAMMGSPMVGGALGSAASKFSEEGSSLGDVALSGVVGGAVGKASEVIGKVVSPYAKKVLGKVGDKVTQVGESWGLKGFGSPKTIAKFDEKFGQGAFEDMVGNNGITRDAEGLAKANAILDAKQQSYDDIVVNSGKKIKLNTVYKEVMKRVDDLNTTGLEVDKSKAAKMLIELKNYLAKDPGFNVDVGDLTSQRKLYGDAVKKYTFDESAKGVYQEMRDAFQKAIYDGTKDLGSAKLLGKELNKLIEFGKILSSASLKGTTTKAFSGLRDAVPPIVAGAAFHNPAVGAGLWGLEKLASSPKGVLATSKAVQGIGSGISKVAKTTLSPFVKGAIGAGTRMLTPAISSQITDIFKKKKKGQ